MKNATDLAARNGLKITTNHPRQPNNSMKLTLNACALLALTSLTLLTGCAGKISPLTVQSLTTLAVYEIAKNNSKTADYMRTVQPVACDIATQQGATLEDVVGAIENARNASIEEKAAVNIVLSIFQTATTQSTNTTQQAPYLKAVFCDGWSGGLAISPDNAIKGVNEPPKQVKGRWVLVR